MCVTSSPPFMTLTKLQQTFAQRSTIRCKMAPHRHHETRFTCLLRPKKNTVTPYSVTLVGSCRIRTFAIAQATTGVGSREKPFKTAVPSFRVVVCLPRGVGLSRNAMSTSVLTGCGGHVMDHRCISKNERGIGRWWQQKHERRVNNIQERNKKKMNVTKTHKCAIVAAAPKVTRFPGTLARGHRKRRHGCCC